MSLPHAVLLGRMSQWVFARGWSPVSHSHPGEAASPQAMLATPGPSRHRTQTAASHARGKTYTDLPADGAEPGISQVGHYFQVVISGSHDLAAQSKDVVLGEVLRELKAVFAEAKEAQLLDSRIVTERRAVFSPRPGIASLRPSQTTAIDNLFLAGDWTQTYWPSTMESAVRSGYLAAEAILRSLGRPERLLVDDLPRPLLSRLLLGKV